MARRKSRDGNFSRAGGKNPSLRSHTYVAFETELETILKTKIIAEDVKFSTDEKIRKINLRITVLELLIKKINVSSASIAEKEDLEKRINNLIQQVKNLKKNLK